MSITHVTDGKIRRLMEALIAYRQAQLGQLNATADELAAAARDCGWRDQGSGPKADWSRNFLRSVGIDA